MKLILWISKLEFLNLIPVLKNCSVSVYLLWFFLPSGDVRLFRLCRKKEHFSPSNYSSIALTSVYSMVFESTLTRISKFFESYLWSTEWHLEVKFFWRSSPRSSLILGPQSRNFGDFFTDISKKFERIWYKAFIS